MKTIYLDNASSTQLDKKVLEAMTSCFGVYGNPSSLHSYGREAKILLENARKNIANILHVDKQTIFFTSSATEANNWIINNIINNGVKYVITSKLEHPSVLNPIEPSMEGFLIKDSSIHNNEKQDFESFPSFKEEYLTKRNHIHTTYLNTTALGIIDYNHLEDTLRKNKRNNTFVSLMHANNEIGNISDIKLIGDLCKKYGALFHSDTAQTIGHYDLNLNDVNIDFCVCSAHKFHGPKGIGFLYARESTNLLPYILGGKQETALRGGTENISGIIGMAKALEISYDNLKQDREYIISLKYNLITKLKNNIEGIEFNGSSGSLNPDKNLYNLVNIKIPTSIPIDMLLLKLDMLGIAVSAGSACSSGTINESHVLKTIRNDLTMPSLRVSLSKYNTIEEIDYFVTSLKSSISILL